MALGCGGRPSAAQARGLAGRFGTKRENAKLCPKRARGEARCMRVASFRRSVCTHRARLVSARAMACLSSECCCGTTCSTTPLKSIRRPLSSKCSAEKRKDSKCGERRLRPPRNPSGAARAYARRLARHASATAVASSSLPSGLSSGASSRALPCAAMRVKASTMAISVATA
eukprot:6163109-Pleurochrysis_carterae.AAC.2